MPLAEAERLLEVGRTVERRLALLGIPTRSPTSVFYRWVYAIISRSGLARDRKIQGMRMYLANALINTLWFLFGGVVGGVGSVAVTAFTNIGDRFLQYLVKRREETFKHGLETELEAFKHGLEAQIEQLRAKLAHLGDRGIRSNELEYKAIIIAWEQFADAYVATHNCVVSFISHPDFKQMSSTSISKNI